MDTIVNKKFGELTVVSCQTKKFKSTSVKVCLVRCSCGTEKTLQQTLLTTGKWVNCRQGIHASSLENLEGKTFGYWSVGKYNPQTKKWGCICQCGTVKEQRANTLKSGKSQSCGCKTSEILSGIRKKPDNLRIKNTIYKGYKTSAKKKKRNFQLTKEQFFGMIQSKCHYCGVGPETKWNDLVYGTLKFPVKNFLYNGIDRKDNSLGYTLENCVPCCSKCNLSKRTMSIDEWKQWIQRVYQFQFIQ